MTSKTMPTLKFTIAISIFLVVPFLADANMGGVVWPPLIRLSQTDQNAIVAWSRGEEILVLSTNWERESGSGGEATSSALLLEVLPLPSEPSEVKEVEKYILEDLVSLLNEKLRTSQYKAPGEPLNIGGAEGTGGVEVVFEKIVGAYDVTIVKVQELVTFLKWIDEFAAKKGLPAKDISNDFRKGITNYLKRQINYFVFSVVDVSEQKYSVKPLFFRFSSDYLYFPMLISGVSEIGESNSFVNLFLITERRLRLPEVEQFWQGRVRHYENSDLEILFSKQELAVRVSSDLADLFTVNDLMAKRVVLAGKLKNLDKDFTILPSFKQEYLRIGQRNEEVRALQKLLLNEDCWDSDYEATGYFGAATKAALIKFQEKYKAQILTPLGLEKGTGFFGSATKSFVNDALGLGGY